MASGNGDSRLSVEKFRECLGIREPADFPFVRFADFRVRKHLLFLGEVGFRYDGFGIYEKRRIFRKVFFGVPNENPHAFAFERTGYVGFRTVVSGNRPSGLQIIPGHGGHADSADAHHMKVGRFCFQEVFHTEDDIAPGFQRNTNRRKNEK